jgi:TusA-related sulfurtransferase
MSSLMQDIYLNVCSLNAPEPMVRILDALAELDPPTRLQVVIESEPQRLYRILERHAFCHSIARRADQLYDLLIWHMPQVR